MEQEQGGKRWAGYGEALLPRLAADLIARFGRGFSVDNLETMRLFFQTYPTGPEKSQTLSRILTPAPLDTEATLVRLVAESVHDHNALIPRAVLGGRTPDEVFLGEGPDVSETLRAATATARTERVAANRALAGCGGCGGVRGDHVGSLVGSGSVR